jgi:predicted nucleic acid-binding protein
MRVLLDTNVVMDVLMARQPFLEDSARVFDRIEQRQVDGFLCATCLTTVEYLLERDSVPAGTRRKIIKRLLGLFEIADVNRRVLEAAIDDNWADFEDAVTHQSARLKGVDVIVTRNVKDFAGATMSVWPPAEFLQG